VVLTPRALSLVSTFLDAEEGREEAMKTSHLEVSQSIPMNFELVAHALNASAWTNSLCCTKCHVPLNLHQPDEERPSQLLGTCDACSRWFFLVESESDWEGMLLFELPTAETIRAMLALPAAVH
jgi:hypothetical protein